MPEAPLSLLQHLLRSGVAIFKHLAEHHDFREKNILYPWLDRITTEEERSSLLKQCRGPEEVGKRDQTFFAISDRSSTKEGEYGQRNSSIGPSFLA